ncbi:MAG: leucine-rich repeat domain-containing protein [Clostridiales bacterium]|nr:leucine-rich repeat domain-containing protein [Clostridiales bacterium]
MVFWHCTSLDDIIVSKDNQKYDSRDNCNAIIETESDTLVAGCNNTIIPSSITSIGNDAFADCSGLERVQIPESVTSIGDNAFLGCSGLTEVVIPESVTSIGNNAFLGCSGLTDLVIPKSITSIGNEAFSSCYGLNKIMVANENPKYDSRDNCNAIIETESNVLITGCKTTQIPSSITSLSYCAFAGCSGLKKVIIPESVTSIDVYAFAGCSSLSEIVIPSSVEHFGDSVFGDYTMGKCSSDMIIYTQNGSAAERYAKQNGYTVKLIDDNTSPLLPTDDTKPVDNPVTPPADDNSKPLDENLNNNANTVAGPAAKGSIMTLENLKCNVKVLSDTASNPTVEILEQQIKILQP